MFYFTQTDKDLEIYFSTAIALKAFLLGFLVFFKREPGIANSDLAILYFRYDIPANLIEMNYRYLILF